MTSPPAPGPTQAHTNPTDPNDHVRAYLRHYLGFGHAPHFAVLLTGPWGIGKTHLLRRFLKEEMGGRTVAYVSLYGMMDTEEIDDALFATLYPRATGKAARIAGGVAKAVLRHVKYEVDLDKADVLDRFAADLYVFDDLERCGMPVGSALGYINQFVEHDGCKVVIVANIDEIREDERAEFARRREKIVGKSLEVRSAFAEAYAWFCSKIDDPSTATLLDEEASEVAALYEQSGLNNLRILQQTLWDFERIHVVLDERQRGHRPGVRTLLRLIVALSFELKAGRLAPADLRDRMRSVLLGFVGEGKTATPLRIADDRYPAISLHDTILDDDALQDALVAGVVNGPTVRGSLDRSAWFSSGEQTAWRIVWHAQERTDAEVISAISEMDAQFANHHFVLGGEIMHVVGLQLHLSDLGMTGLTREQTVDRAKAYIDELRHRGTLELPREPGQNELRYGGYGGLGITQADTPEVSLVFHHLREARAGAAADVRPAKAAELLDEMASDPALFVRRITDGTPDSRFPREPVMTGIDPDAFVTGFLALPPLDQQTVSQGLLWRWEHARLLNELADELPWAKRVAALLTAAAEDAAPLTRDRLLRTLRFTIGKRLTEAEPPAAAAEADASEQR